MGNEFFWFLDIITLAVFAVHIYRGATKGAVGVLISAAAIIIAAVAAATFSAPISEGIYDSLIRDKVESHVVKAVDSAFGNGEKTDVSKLDMSRAMIKGKYLYEIEPEFDETGSTKIDLSSVDLSETGIEDVDLTVFGLSGDTDFTDIKSGIATITKEDTEKHGLGNVVLAKIIAANITSEKINSTLSDIGERLSGTYAAGLKSFGRDLSSGSTDAVYPVILAMLPAATGEYGEKIMTDIVTPIVLPPLKMAVFLLLFVLVTFVLNLIANLTKLINRIPVIGKVNGVLGAVLGALEAVILIFIICLAIRLAIYVCGNSMVFLNQPTIDRTFLFKYLYSIDIFG